MDWVGSNAGSKEAAEGAIWGLSFRTSNARCAGLSRATVPLFLKGCTNLGNSPITAGNSSADCRAKRMVPRYSFIATTELTDAENATRLSGRVTEISRQGCYVDIMNALPVGDVLNLRISNDQGTFVARGKIIYVHERIGMGVVFMDPPEDQLHILDTWLQELPPGAAIA